MPFLTGKWGKVGELCSSTKVVPQGNVSPVLGYKGGLFYFYLLISPLPRCMRAEGFNKGVFSYGNKAFDGK